MTSEREYFEETMTETTEERDLQVTDRTQFSSDVASVVQEKLEASGNVKVKSSGAVTITAEAGVGYERSISDTSRAVAEQARETIDKAIERTYTRNRSTERSLARTLTREQNDHGFERDAKAKENVSGIYQYLQLVSLATVESHGERTLYDIIIPEPGASALVICERQSGS